MRERGSDKATTPEGIVGSGVAVACEGVWELASTNCFTKAAKEGFRAMIAPGVEALIGVVGLPVQDVGRGRKGKIRGSGKRG